MTTYKVVVDGEVNAPDATTAQEMVDTGDWVALNARVIVPPEEESP